MKKILISSMASILLLSSTTYAQGAVTHNTHMVQKTSFSKKDAQALFGTNKVKATTLNNGEMAKTEGAYGWWGGLGGAAMDAYGYLGHSTSSGSFSLGGLGGAMAGGAFIGVTRPSWSPSAWTAASHAGMAGGFVSGLFH